MTDEHTTTAAARADLCRFLAGCYYQPAPEFSEENLFESMLAAATQVDPALEVRTRRLGRYFISEGIDNLLVDYARLFLGPSDILAKPYGSVWLTGEKTLMQDSTSAVSELYREAGFDLDQTFRELPDHIAAELEFLYLLIYRENEARFKEDVSGVQKVARLRTRFLNGHLGRWVSAFTAAIGAGARTGFYRELGELTNVFVALEERRRVA
jgi:TorA maturation chaperone TorD